MSRPLLGGFLKGGICATVAWGIAWPLEVVKSKVQGANSKFKGKSIPSILISILKSDGVMGMYRGFMPGAMRSFVANGVGMAVYQLTQSLRTD
jgi:solute carrier family 25 carnitine/acylcarnitine transporter 20/29